MAADGQEDVTPLGRRLFWFAIYWCAGVLVVSAVAFLIRLWI